MIVSILVFLIPCQCLLVISGKHHFGSSTLSLGGGVGRASLKVKAKLAPEMLRRISFNGRRVIQTTDGYIRIQAGLVILVT